MSHPDVMILDEATEGLAPLVVAEIWRVLEGIRRRDRSSWIGVVRARVRLVVENPHDSAFAATSGASRIETWARSMECVVCRVVPFTLTVGSNP
jgi:ABC-type branched-subunit amino acid transport system ATPase component